MREPQSGGPEAGTGEKRRKRRWAAWLVVPVLLGGLAWACQLRLAAPRVYQAQAELEVLRAAPPAPADPLIGAAPQEDDAMETQVALMQNSEMAYLTLEELKNEAMAKTGQSNVPFNEPQIAQAVHVTNLPGTRLLAITAEAGTPEQARDLAEGTAKAFVRWKRDDAQAEQREAETSLTRRYMRARRAAERARQEPAFPTGAPANAPVTADPPVTADARRQTAQVTTDIARRLQVALDAARLQSDQVPSSVVIVQHAVVLREPESGRRF